MLASHALMLMGVPLNRVVKRIRMFREARYKLFKGFFRGITDAEDEALEKHQLRLHSVSITASAYAVGKRFIDVELQDHVEIQSIRRPNLKSLEPTSDTVFEEGDVVVLLGEPQYLVGAEKALLQGR
jgi:CPA2 family monovalent cation:H+ antiporter-2